MRITDQQVLLLFDVLKDSLLLGNDIRFSLADSARIDLYKKILGQQDPTVRDLLSDDREEYTPSEEDMGYEVEELVQTPRILSLIKTTKDE